MNRVSYYGLNESNTHRSDEHSTLSTGETELCQVHVRLYSRFDPTHAKIRRPTESFLRKVFMEYGYSIHDIVIKEYHMG